MRYADTPTEEAVVRIDAPPGRVWDLVSDITLMAELSSELQEVQWLDGVTGPAVGHTFRGRSAHPNVGEWETVSTVVECDAPRAFGWAVVDPEHPSATWRFTIVTDDGGTELRQWAQLGPGPSHLTTAIERMPDKEERIVARRLRDWRAGMESNLAAIKERAEQP